MTRRPRSTRAESSGLTDNRGAAVGPMGPAVCDAPTSWSSCPCGHLFPLQAKRHVKRQVNALPLENLPVRDLCRDQRTVFTFPQILKPLLYTFPQKDACLRIHVSARWGEGPESCLGHETYGRPVFSLANGLSLDILPVLARRVANGGNGRLGFRDFQRASRRACKPGGRRFKPPPPQGRATR